MTDDADRRRGLELIQLILDPEIHRTCSERKIGKMFSELEKLTGHPAPSDVLFWTFGEEDLEAGLVLTPEFLFDFMIRTKNFKR